MKFSPHDLYVLNSRHSFPHWHSHRFGFWMEFLPDFDIKLTRRQGNDTKLCYFYLIKYNLFDLIKTRHI